MRAHHDSVGVEVFFGRNELFVGLAQFRLQLGLLLLGVVETGHELLLRLGPDFDEVFQIGLQASFLDLTEKLIKKIAIKRTVFGSLVKSDF